jgi:hypothetical protein
MCAFGLKLLIHLTLQGAYINPVVVMAFLNNLQSNHQLFSGMERSEFKRPTDFLSHEYILSTFCLNWLVSVDLDASCLSVNF